MVSTQTGQSAPARVSTDTTTRVREALVISQAEHLSSALAAALAASGFRITMVASERAALTVLECLPIEVVLLDVELPDIASKEFIVCARGTSDAPIILLSAAASEEDKVEVLDLGANDFLTKPYSIPELMARIRVATRPAAKAEQRSDAIDVSFDFDRRRVTVSGRARSLTDRETALLRVLAAAEGQTVPYDVLLKSIWPTERRTGLTHLRVLAWQTRRKIEPNAAHPQLLLVVQGLGYRLVRPGEIGRSQVQEAQHHSQRKMLSGET